MQNKKIETAVIDYLMTTWIFSNRFVFLLQLYLGCPEALSSFYFFYSCNNSSGALQAQLEPICVKQKILKYLVWDIFEV